MKRNLWTDHASALTDAYTQSAGNLRFELVTRALLMHMPAPPRRVVDVGGGFGQQAIMLARVGYSVVVLDFDPKMLAIAQDRLSTELPEVVSRIDFVVGEGEEAASIVGTDFDLACSHSVLMYQDDPAPMLSELVALVRPGGLVSVLCVNRAASGMRSGLQGRWRDAIRSLEAGTQVDNQYVAGREHTPEEVSDILEAAGARVKAWYGVGVFTDHLREKLVVENPEEVYAAEWLAGNRDPYRQVARCFHLIAERT